MSRKSRKYLRDILFPRHFLTTTFSDIKLDGLVTWQIFRQVLASLTGVGELDFRLYWKKKLENDFLCMMANRLKNLNYIVWPIGYLELGLI